jgi:plastocyanin
MVSTRLRATAAVCTGAIRCLAVPAIATAVLLIADRAPGAQQGGPIRGHVEIGVPISARRPTSAAYPGRSVPAAALAPVSELRNVVVYLRNAPPRPLPPVHAEIRQHDETFLPRVVAVPVGSIVDFPNDDPIYHNVFSLSSASKFNLGRYPQGKSKSVKFDKPGLVRVFCDIHSHMSATVLVFNHPWFAVPDESGRFELPEVPAGDREITAWHERLGDTSLVVRVDSGRSATADFVLPVPAK